MYVPLELFATVSAWFLSVAAVSDDVSVASGGWLPHVFLCLCPLNSLSCQHVQSLSFLVMWHCHQPRWYIGAL